MSSAALPRILGAVLCGGASKRFGSDKAEARLGAATLLTLTNRALEKHCGAVIMCGARRPGYKTIADRPMPDMGPLGGLCAALHYGADHGFTHVLSAPVDVHPMPEALVDVLAGEGPAVLDRHWLLGLWPTRLAAALEAHLSSGERKVLSWIEAAQARRIAGFEERMVNINTTADLEQAERSASRASKSSASCLPIEGARSFGCRQIDFGTQVTQRIDRQVPIECPVAIEYNGIGYAVMMATPTDLADFAIGFSVSEGLAGANQVSGPQIFETDGGYVVRCNLPAASLPRVLERARTRVSESGCGICGIDSIAAALAPLSKVKSPVRVEPEQIHRAVEALRDYQPLGRATGASHAAAFCNSGGDILLVREDVGRHNAFDKLIGALCKTDTDIRNGFVLLSARCSQELVEKAVRAGFPMMVTISAPSSLAIERAIEGGLTLIALARRDSALIVNDPAGLFLGKSGRFR